MVKFPTARIFDVFLQGRYRHQWRRSISCLLLGFLLFGVVTSCTSPGTGAITGDSLVANASDFDNHDPGIPLIGFPGYDPEHLNSTGELVKVIANHPKTVVLNWNGNNDRSILGSDLVRVYESSIRIEISYLQRHGVRTVALATPMPSKFNDAAHSVNIFSTESKLPGRMLGSYAIAAMELRLAHTVSGVQFWTAAARSIYPHLIFDSTKTVDGLVHLTPAWYRVYAPALRKIARGND